MYPAALITLGGSCSRLADRHFETLHRPDRVLMVTTRSGAAFAIDESLKELGSQAVILAVGFAGALAHKINIGDIIVPTAARDHVTKNGGVHYPDTDLARLLAVRCGQIASVHTGTIGTVRSILRGRDVCANTMLKQGSVAAEMEVACVFRLLGHHATRGAAILVCSDHVFQAPLPDDASSFRGLPLTPNVVATTKLVLDRATELLSTHADSGQF